jgi:hypothetical protein
MHYFSRYDLAISLSVSRELSPPTTTLQVPEANLELTDIGWLPGEGSHRVMTGTSVRRIRDKVRLPASWLALHRRRDDDDDGDDDDDATAWEEAIYCSVTMRNIALAQRRQQQRLADAGADAPVGIYRVQRDDTFAAFAPLVLRELLLEQSPCIDVPAMMRIMQDCLRPHAFNKTALDQICGENVARLLVVHVLMQQQSSSSRPNIPQSTMRQLATRLADEYVIILTTHCRTERRAPQPPAAAAGDVKYPASRPVTDAVATASPAILVDDMDWTLAAATTPVSALPPPPPPQRQPTTITTTRCACDCRV